MTCHLCTYYIKKTLFAERKMLKIAQQQQQHDDDDDILPDSTTNW